jgi:hypothetical protein
MNRKLTNRSRHGTISMYSNHGCRCKPCKSAHREYVKTHPASGPTWRRSRRKLAGCEDISEQDCINMLKAQGDMCAICMVPLVWPDSKTCVDHDHKTGRVRGILCTGCNSGLGHFKDSIVSLRRAIKYILKSIGGN